MGVKSGEVVFARSRATVAGQGQEINGVGVPVSNQPACLLHALLCLLRSTRNVCRKTATRAA